MRGGKGHTAVRAARLAREIEDLRAAGREIPRFAGNDRFLVGASKVAKTKRRSQTKWMLIPIFDVGPIGLEIFFAVAAEQNGVLFERHGVGVIQCCRNGHTFVERTGVLECSS